MAELYSRDSSLDSPRPPDAVSPGLPHWTVCRYSTAHRLTAILLSMIWFMDATPIGYQQLPQVHPRQREDPEPLCVPELHFGTR